MRLDSTGLNNLNGVSQLIPLVTDITYEPRGAFIPLCKNRHLKSIYYSTDLTMWSVGLARSL